MYRTSLRALRSAALFQSKIIRFRIPVSCADFAITLHFGGGHIGEDALVRIGCTKRSRNGGLFFIYHSMITIEYRKTWQWLESDCIARALRLLSQQMSLGGAVPLRRRRAGSDRSMTGETRKRPPKNTEKQAGIRDTKKAFKTTELKMPDIVGLFSILTQKLTHFHT